MKAVQWWLRVVGALYLLEGISISAMALFAPESFAEVWTSAPPGTLEAVAVRGLMIAGLPGVLTWVLLGAAMWILSRSPARAAVLVAIVAGWELLVWLPVDLLASFNGFEAGRAITLMSIHVIIGVSGLLVLRRAKPLV